MKQGAFGVISISGAASDLSFSIRIPSTIDLFVSPVNRKISDAMSLIGRKIHRNLLDINNICNSRALNTIFCRVYGSQSHRNPEEQS